MCVGSGVKKLWIGYLCKMHIIFEMCNRMIKNSSTHNTEGFLLHNHWVVYVNRNHEENFRANDLIDYFGFSNYKTLIITQLV